MLSIECLPGSRPELKPEDLAQGAELWVKSYRTLKDLRAKGLADAEDEVTVLFKLADAPEGVPRDLLRPPKPEPVEAVDG